MKVTIDLSAQPKQTRKARITVRISPVVKADIERKAQDLGVSPSELINRVLSSI